MTRAALAASSLSMRDTEATASVSVADQIGTCTTVLQPLYALIERHVLAAERLHGDDTTVAIPAKGKTVKGHIWTYVRDDRPFAGLAKPISPVQLGRDKMGWGRQAPVSSEMASLEHCRVAANHLPSDCFDRTRK
jgi:transposase IS66 family protein